MRQLHRCIPPNLGIWHGPASHRSLLAAYVTSANAPSLMIDTAAPNRIAQEPAARPPHARIVHGDVGVQAPC